MAAAPKDYLNLNTSVYYHDTILALMEECRASIDAIESVTSDEFWPFPTYRDILFGN